MGGPFSDPRVLRTWQDRVIGAASDANHAVEILDRRKLQGAQGRLIRILAEHVHTLAVPAAEAHSVRDVLQQLWDHARPVNALDDDLEPEHRTAWLAAAELLGLVPCTACDGRGSWPPEYERCETCSGEGWAPKAAAAARAPHA